MAGTTAEERWVTLEGGHRVWTRTAGTGDGIPLLLLHGGPGAGHDYLEPLEALGTERPVIFYDQLGCGRSDRPDDASLWTIERFCMEIDQVRDVLGLAELHLLGQSWGGWLGIEYLLGQPAGVRSAVLASTSASLPQFAAEARRLIDELPAKVRDTLVTFAARDAFDDPEYEAAVEVFYRQHVCRLPEWPACLMRTVDNVHHNPVYETMNGPNEFTIVGNLKDWDRTDRLAEISIPVLITVGRYDEITPACSETMHERLPKSELVVFEHSSHTAHLEETESYLQIVGGFLSAND